MTMREGHGVALSNVRLERLERRRAEFEGR